MSVKSKKVSRADSVVVLDFETSGQSPDMGDRAIEIGAVMIGYKVSVGSIKRFFVPFLIRALTGTASRFYFNLNWGVKKT